MVRKRDPNAPAPGRRAFPTCRRPCRRERADRAQGVRSSPLRFRPPPGRRTAGTTISAGEKIDHRRRHDDRRVLPCHGDAAVPEHGARPLQPAYGEGRPLRPPHRLWRPCHQHRAGAQLQRPRQRVPHRRHQRRRAMSLRASPATRSMPGPKCRRSRSCPAGAISALSACALSPSRTAPAPISPMSGRDGKPHPSVVLDLDYWVFMPR